jgi:hypothetical protein
MRRLLLAALGAVGTVVVAEAVRRSSDGRPDPTGNSPEPRAHAGKHAAAPAEAVSPLPAPGSGAGDAPRPARAESGTSVLQAVVDRFRTAMAEREDELVTRLLVTPEGGDPGAVFGRRGGSRRSWDDDDPGVWADDVRPARPARGATRADDAARPSGRVDHDEPLYDF